MIKSVIFNRDEKFYSAKFNYTDMLSLWYINYKMDIIEEYSPCYAEGTHLIGNDDSLELHTSTTERVPLPIPFSISSDRVFGMPGEFNNGFRLVAAEAIDELHKDNIRIKTILDCREDDLSHRELISPRFFNFLLNKLNLEGGIIHYE